MKDSILSDVLSDLLVDLKVLGHALTCYGGVHTARAGLTFFRVLQASHLRSCPASRWQSQKAHLQNNKTEVLSLDSNEFLSESRRARLITKTF